jgi:hypothetical protein
LGNDGAVRATEKKDLYRWNEYILPSKDTPIDTRPLLQGVACPADGDCLAGGIHGSDAIIASTTDNWAQFTYEMFQGIEVDGPASILSFGCESVNRCVAVGGTALVGVRKPQHTR